MSYPCSNQANALVTHGYILVNSQSASLLSQSFIKGTALRRKYQKGL